MTLCQQISRLEWSGTLFYTVTGEFGDPDFAIRAEELYLLDIGSAAYTEYETGDPDFIQFMMQRADLREMRMGHIHSHNTMSSFFSGTDDSELMENSAFHNYYFSLIVNNKNQLVAKVAFRAQVESKTTSIVQFKGTDGNVKERHLEQQKTESFVYTHECDITPPAVVTATVEAVELLKEKDAARKKEEREKKYGPFRSDSTPYVKNGGLFGDDDDKVATKETKAEKKEDDDWSESFSRRPSRPVNKEAVKVLRKLIILEGSTKNMFDDVLNETVKHIWSTRQHADYMKEMSLRIPDLYLETFPDDPNFEKADIFYMDCIDILIQYQNVYPMFSDGAIKAFAKHVTPTTSY
jgi:hypothetical protein